MILSVLFLLLGLALIYFGAEFFTGGAVSFAERLKISPLVIGLTIVAAGTSMPELSVSLTAAINHSSDISLGNVVGSNIVNSLIILGLTAVVAPLTVQRSSMNIEIPFCIAVSLLLVLLANDRLFFGGAENVIGVVDGIIFLLLVLLFTFYNIRLSKKMQGMQREPEEEARTDANGQKPQAKQRPLWLAVVMFFGGLTMLILGGRYFVKGASDIALAMGVSEAIVGLTIVAIGTSLPELATSVVAAFRKQPEIALGNVVGSNIFNILFILGVTSVISPIKASGILMEDYIAMIVSIVLVFLFAAVIGRRTISRWEGAVLILTYVGYTALLVMRT